MKAKSFMSVLVLLTLDVRIVMLSHNTYKNNMELLACFSGKVSTLQNVRFAQQISMIGSLPVTGHIYISYNNQLSYFIFSSLMFYLSERRCNFWVAGFGYRTAGEL